MEKFHPNNTWHNAIEMEPLMATVIVRQAGAAAREVTVGTVAELKRKLTLGQEYSVRRDGEVLSEDTQLNDDDVLHVARNEKGA